MNNSVWTSDTVMPAFKSLECDKNTDVLIIGGGICGILCAYFLEKNGVAYILAEGGKILCGISKNTTAKITSQHGLIYDKLMRTLGKEKAQMYLEANEDALREYKKMCKDIDCDFENQPAYTYTLKDKKKIENEVRAANELGMKARFAQTTALPFETKGAVCFENQAQFNPVKFISKIAKGLNIYENTFIREINRNTASFYGGKITAKKIIVTTHFPFINKHGSYFLKLYQSRSYVSAYENMPAIYGMYIDESQKGLSLRSYKNLLLLGGGAHRTGKNGSAWREIHNFADRYYPDANPKYEWAAQDCMSLDGVAYIGKYSKQTPNLYVASGFNKWGMSLSMAAAKMLCDMVTDKKSEYEEVFSPQRSILKPQLLVNGFEAMTNLVTLTAKRCPHMGCALKWNKYEHSWDCPCHGSRFEKDGKLMDNPAMENAKIGTSQI